MTPRSDASNLSQVKSCVSQNTRKNNFSSNGTFQRDLQLGMKWETRRAFNPNSSLLTNYSQNMPEESLRCNSLRSSKAKSGRKL
jgi:hypothetical protein